MADKYFRISQNMCENTVNFVVERLHRCIYDHGESVENMRFYKYTFDIKQLVFNAAQLKIVKL